MFCVNHFRPYLYGRKFTLVTDHKPLVWFQNNKDPCSRLSRWRLKLAEYDFDVVYKAGKMNVNADALSRNPIIDEEISRNLQEDDDDTFMTSQEEMNLENAFIKINQGNNIKKGNTSKNKYFNSVFAEDDANHFSETSEGPISNVNLSLSEIFNRILIEKLLNEINKDIVKYKNLFKLLSSKLPVINNENSPWKTMTTRGKKKKQEQMKISNQHKNLENLNQNEVQGN